MEVRVYKFDDRTLDDVQIIHDNDFGGPRAAYAFYLGRMNYFGDTSDLDTNEVEDFICAFYNQYNQRFGIRY